MTFAMGGVPHSGPQQATNIKSGELYLEEFAIWLCVDILCC